MYFHRVLFLLRILTWAVLVFRKYPRIQADMFVLVLAVRWSVTSALQDGALSVTYLSASRVYQAGTISSWLQPKSSSWLEPKSLSWAGSDRFGDKFKIWVWLGSCSNKVWISKLNSGSKKRRFTSWASDGLGGSENVKLDPVGPIWIKLDLIFKFLFKFIKCYNFCNTITYVH